MHPTPATRQRPRLTTLAGLAAAALGSAVIPAAAGLAFLISLAARRPLVAVAARRWPWLTGRPAAPPPHRTLTGLTAAWAPACWPPRPSRAPTLSPAGWPSPAPAASPPAP